MRDAVMSRLIEATVVIATAAVSDYKPKAAASQKIKRSGPISLELEPTADILAEIVRTRDQQGADRQDLHKKDAHRKIVVGFAAETENVLENARKKLAAKALDAIVVNDVSRPEIGFESERNAVTIITHDDIIEVPETSKWEVALRVLDQVVRLRKLQSHPQHAPVRAGR
jgi:phosphopantothenoylcysteine decarboxylase/phosphopantothenate--cysteine ligase